MKDEGQTNAAPAKSWDTSFLPSDITFINLKTGRQIQEPSLIAVRCAPASRNPRIADYVLAVGSAALDYRDTPGVAVFSPLRYGQIAHFTDALLMFRTFLQTIRPKTDFILKPIICVHAQKHVTEVEERALVDAAMLMGARRVFLYQEPLSTFLDIARGNKMLKNAYVLHIEPRDTEVP